METLKQINCKFETSLAYYEMCAEDVMFDYYTESEGDLSKDSAATKSIWARIKEIVAKIFKSLGETISKIGAKIREVFKGKDMKNELDDIKTFVQDDRNEVKNIKIDAPDFAEEAKVIKSAEKEVQTMKRDLAAHKEIDLNSAKQKKQEFDEKVKSAKKKHTGRNIAIVIASLFAADAVVSAVLRKSVQKNLDEQLSKLYSEVADASDDTTNADVASTVASYEANVEKSKADMATQAAAATAQLIKLKKGQTIKNPYTTDRNFGPFIPDKSNKHIDKFLSSKTNKSIIDEAVDKNKTITNDDSLLKRINLDIIDSSQKSLDKSVAAAKRIMHR